MGGYACKRTSKYYAREVYGELKLPSSWAGVCPGDAPGASNTAYQGNIIPEMLFGMYNGPGFDAGIRVTHGGSWRPFISGYNCFVDDNMLDGAVFSKSDMQPGTTLRMKCWIEKVGNEYYAKLNVTKSTNYDATDLMSKPLSKKLKDATLFNEGGEVNREIVIAANAHNYEQSGCYSLGGTWLYCMYTTPSGKTYIWNDANSLTFTSNGKKMGGSGAYVLELRKDDYPSYDTRRIKISNVGNNNYTGAIESVNIDFRPTPSI